MENFKGKKILVTGGCRGIGRGIALELYKQGAYVVVLSNIEENLNKLKNEYPNIETIVIDLSSWDETRKIVDTLGHFDGLVNNAGVAILDPFLKCTEANFDKTMIINVKATLNISQIVAEKMIKNGTGGSIVNISSQASKVALTDHVAYCASKGAVDAMTRVMALELGKHNIRVNSVNPTIVMTELGKQAWSDTQKSQAMLSKIPLGRFAEISDVVNAVIFLLNDASGMISGVHLPVDGGFLAT